MRAPDHTLSSSTPFTHAVYKGMCKRSREIVVLKSYTLSSICELYQHQIYREVRLHSSLQHENIVKLYAAFKEGDRVVMVQEYADGGDLFSLLQKYGGRLGEKVAVQMVLDPFLRVLQYLHTRSIVHRDIKPGEFYTRCLALCVCWLACQVACLGCSLLGLQCLRKFQPAWVSSSSLTPPYTHPHHPHSAENILFTKHNMCLKLADFGLAIDLREERAVTRAGTLDYMAPGELAFLAVLRRCDD